MQAKRDARATQSPATAEALEDALQNLQLELESFMLGLEKLELTLFAERRQAEEYADWHVRGAASACPAEIRVAFPHECARDEH